MTIEPVLPDYTGACISNVIPALLEHPDAGRGWIPQVVLDAEQVVLFVIDGLGWNQLDARRARMPTLAAMAGGPITTVAPSTTASALTSLTTGVPPGEHGVVGYQIFADGEVLNVLRWTTASGDARERIPPGEFQKVPAFLDRRPPVITKAEFMGSGFTMAHLADTRLVPYRHTSTLVTEVRRSVVAGEPFVYAYYAGVDMIAHEYGLGEHYEAELGYVDRLVADLQDTLPEGAALMVTADHGHVHVGDAVMEIDPAVAAAVGVQSGEARFRWLHARPGRHAQLAEAAAECHSGDAWVVTREQVVDEGWLGSVLTDAAIGRLGDVALVARTDVAFVDSTETPLRLIGRHGSVTAAEMLVPLLAAPGS